MAEASNNLASGTARSRVFRHLAILLICVLAFIGALTIVVKTLRPWSLSGGGFQYLSSPNGQFTFHASNLSDDAPWGRPYAYCKFEITNTATGKVLKTVTVPFPEELEPKNYRLDPMMIEWAPDSTSVSVPITDGVRIHVDVPSP